MRAEVSRADGSKFREPVRASIQAGDTSHRTILSAASTSARNAGDRPSRSAWHLNEESIESAGEVDRRRKPAPRRVNTRF